MNVPASKPDKKYTYAEYLQWPGNERWEIIDGKPFLMSPAPLTEHQRVLGQLFGQIWMGLQQKPCQVFPAPFDVRLPRGEENDNEIDTVVQPDIVVVCDPAKIDKRGCKGAPDLIIEILSYSTAKKDLNEKFNLYERVGVKEYWVVFPGEAVIEVYQLGKNMKYSKTGTYQDNDQIELGILPELAIDLSLVFPQNQA
ncbi:MAG: Uma2 family endonuclease [Syntrophomonas sp.]|uniref:Uma2 family endonuclease n=1 Tax=Syntrophomonas sp. TaxID=2053627 RepID=UPI0026238DD7|nr:Uma2 family endonuclease [Syntrophomonas sp.]MDD2510960.1 Uma2 family endonuclease [Syntrophomonas sp.]MDD3879224.1 Uma2 family endonuclease [Syntrophomonas sp.]MDD4627117.1 Uma2 family endonuclease [Syntrophomonas sp.]